MSENLIIVADVLVDGTAVPARRDMAVVLDGAKISRIFPADALAEEPGCAVLRFPGCTLLPGLIDAHVHLCMSGGMTPRQTMMGEDNDLLLLRAAHNARTALHAGITTVRDCGDRDGVTFTLRRAIRDHVVEGPRLLLCGRPLTPPRGHCYFMHGEVEGEAAISAAVNDLAGRGADFIKVMGTGGGLTPGTDSLGLQFRPDDLSSIVKRARDHGLPVAVHAHSAAAIHAAAEVGAASIEHATFVTRHGIAVDDVTLGVLAQRRPQVVPTSIPAVNAVREGRTLGLAREVGMTSEAFLAGRRQAVSDLRARGLTILAGTDAGATGVRFTDLAGEIALLADAGMGNEEAIAAATGRSAEALGLRELGRIQPGCTADLIVVRGDASRDLAGLREPCLIVQGGRVVQHANAQPAEAPSCRTLP